MAILRGPASISLIITVATTSLFGFAGAATTATDNCISLNFGQCSDPSIIYALNVSGSAEWAYEPANSNDFPHAATQDLATLETFICAQLQSPCNAPSDTLYACRGALNELSTLTGQDAVDAWNNALGLASSNSDGSGDCTGQTTVYDQGYATTTTITDYDLQSVSSDLSVITITTAITLASSSLTAGATLTLTITLPSETTAAATTGEDSSAATTGTATTATTQVTSISADSTSDSSTPTESLSSSKASKTNQAANIDGDSPFSSAPPINHSQVLLLPLLLLVGFLVLFMAS